MVGQEEEPQRVGQLELEPQYDGSPSDTLVKLNERYGPEGWDTKEVALLQRQNGCIKIWDMQCWKSSQNNFLFVRADART